MNRFFVLVFLLSIVAGCQSDDDNTLVTPKSTVLLKVNIDPASGYANADDWLIVNDSKGTLLGFHSFESGQSFEITTNVAVTDKVIVTRLTKKLDDPAEPYFNILTWAEMTPGQQYVVPAKRTELAGPSGTFILRVDFETEEEVIVPNYQAMVSSSRGFGSGSGGNGGGVIALNSNYYDGVNKYLLAAMDHDQLRYKFFEGVHTGDDVITKFKDMTPFEKQVEFTFPETDRATVITNQSDAGSISTSYSTNTHWPDGTRTSIKSGYIAALEFPKTIVDLTYSNGYRLSYTNLGSIPTGHVNWPAFTDFKILSESINTYAYTAPEGTQYRDAVWTFTEGDTFYGWSFYSSKHEHVVPKLPTELLTKYTGIDGSKFQYKDTYFVMEGRSYEDYIKSYFEKVYQANFELLEVTVTKK